MSVVSPEETEKEVKKEIKVTKDLEVQPDRMDLLAQSEDAVYLDLGEIKARWDRWDSLANQVETESLVHQDFPVLKETRVKQEFHP